MIDRPSTNGANGDARDGRGRFAKGNHGGPGNPNARHVASWRRSLGASIKAADIRDAVAQLVKAARAGQPWAIRELLDRTVGKSASFAELELAARVERLESTVAEREHGVTP